ncbi:ErfK/YbiS/YcfS/YnhG family protein OS=Tsukamurella paurometabola (strain ATCC 8368 / DSM / CCUG 35730 / CIP 100753 / JCM 10117 / KCTC 9821 / NBRC 16120/ NCIMB 702349 / NCTC 13040) OX=521096 GN=Tpau_0088 PE=4 SV=1 [Tsukamurella paurometabola]|uniref:ErfK/YbiS/YcfS/YnhG family protein n=1 Tax=Tsukamurella paurometabola (strain ATCC 8368 / DSM 20162 / CCUG 35730 / CIP 100753 / JCM 10117 / KCTC 9821 / NBRC 16120 / NCIMB 702349 / NCTC 13040) TaxID=521096 RepID=D5UPX4_TSUPD|nr:ErfK/YbiS/YcfS/YnhG family protein [Tsukamurella paurometabola DSM 20162]SUP41438.1 L,D-transpeptidase catalytic domain [Tsukamurella paurometabola]
MTRFKRARSGGQRLVGRRTVLIGAAAAVPLVAGACTIGDTGGKGAAPSTPPKDPAEVTVTPADGAKDVSPIAPVSVSIAKATLGSVTLTDDKGAVVEGTLSTDMLSWKPAAPLAYNGVYTLVAKYQTLGQQREHKTTFSTVVVDETNKTLPYFENTGGNSLNDGAVYGVGQVAVVHFDEPIKDRAMAQKLLTVTTTPPVEGAWSWTTDKTVAWRPKDYYPSGTKVAIEAKVFGKQVSPGLWGEKDIAITFSIGESHVSIADDNTKQVQVFVGGQMVRSMPTSMGQGGTEVVNGTTLHFWTQRGIYTVLDKANPVVMDSSTYGLPINSRLGYKQTIGWATRISNDGIYLHALDNIAAQGVRNESHGCLNLSPANAQWFFGISQPGDVVEVRNTGGAPLEQWQNGDWSVPWATWVAGGAQVDEPAPGPGATTQAPDPAQPPASGPPQSPAPGN